MYVCACVCTPQWSMQLKRTAPAWLRGSALPLAGRQEPDGTSWNRQGAAPPSLTMPHRSTWAGGPGNLGGQKCSKSSELCSSGWGVICPLSTSLFVVTVLVTGTMEKLVVTQERRNFTRGLCVSARVTWPWFSLGNESRLYFLQMPSQKRIP